jgi:hypothetical protein
MSVKKEKDGTEEYLATISDYQQTFNSPAGQKVLLHIMQSCGIMSSSFVKGDSHVTAFNEGQRSVVVQILKTLKIDLRKLEEQIRQQPERDSDAII